jgi:NADH-quinone oxidoreductase subunit N
MDNLELIIPELFLFAWALVVLMLDLFSKKRSVEVPAYASMFGLVVTGFLLVIFQRQGGSLWNDMFAADGFAFMFKIVFLGAAFFATGISFGVVGRMTHHRGEYFALILFSTVSMMFLASAKELITLYIGLELTTIPLFVLAAYMKTNRGSAEAGLKYMVIGAASSALLLYGLSIIYGLTGATSLYQVTINLSIHWLAYGDVGPAFTMAMILIMAGLLFKLAIVPFHMWAPDVYEGSPTPITAFLSVASKGAGLAAVVRIFVGMLIAFNTDIMAPRDWGHMSPFWPL